MFIATDGFTCGCFCYVIFFSLPYTGNSVSSDGNWSPEIGDKNAHQPPPVPAVNLFRPWAESTLKGKMVGEWGGGTSEANVPGLTLSKASRFDVGKTSKLHIGNEKLEHF